jgi:hypothetical protein
MFGLPLRRSLVLSMRELSAMLPLELPPQAFATVRLIASDNSLSAEYARQRFDITDQIALCDHFVSADSKFYLLITLDESHPGAKFALNCNATGEEVGAFDFLFTRVSMIFWLLRRVCVK